MVVEESEDHLERKTGGSLIVAKITELSHKIILESHKIYFPAIQGIDQGVVINGKYG